MKFVANNGKEYHLEDGPTKQLAKCYKCLPLIWFDCQKRLACVIGKSTQLCRMGTKQSFVAWSRDRMPSFCEFLCEKTTIVGFPGLLVEPTQWSRQRRENFIQLYLSWGHIVRDQWACHILAHCSEEHSSKGSLAGTVLQQWAMTTRHPKHLSWFS